MDDHAPRKGRITQEFPVRSSNRKHIAGLLFVIVAVGAACSQESTSLTLGLLTQCAPLGDTIQVSGTVIGVTFNSEEQSGNYELRQERYYLLNDIDLEDPPCAVTIPNGDEWGLGVDLLPASFDPSLPRPQNGVRIRAQGTFQSLLRSTTQSKRRKTKTFPIIEGISQFEIVSSPKDLPSLKLLGQSCSSDMECDENLICDRNSSLCSNPPETVLWDSLWHDLNGACITDDDCPLGQVCHLDYTIGAEGAISVKHLFEQDRGKHICVLAMGVERETLCPRIGTLADFLGGRYVAGKEICIRGKVSQLVGANDGDTHLQLKVSNPIIYPDTSPAYDDFGASTEISPPYKDPLLGNLVITEPNVGENIIVLGTYRFDNGHGWFEMHPLKAWWPDE